jgi:outer membrane cobalamin receptor
VQYPPLLAVSLIACLAVPLAAQGVVSGKVTDAGTARPVQAASVQLVGAGLRGLTNAEGRYEIRDVPPGRYEVQVRSIGRRPETRSIVLSGPEILTADFSLVTLPVPLAEIVVTPGRTGVSQDPAVSSQALSTEELAILPQLGEDVYRAMNRLPGIASSDYSARFWVRGGPERELLTRYDGADLIEPFHLKDFDGSLSIMDVATIGRIELTSGGFTSEYGDRLTGVLAMETRAPPATGSRHTLGLSLSNVRASSEGTFDEGNGEWLLAARRGYLDVALKLAGNDEDLSPRYYDLTAKVTRRFGTGHRVSLHLLHAGDAVDLTDSFGRILESHYGTTFVWGRWAAEFGSTLAANTTVSFSRLRWDRQGEARDIPNSYVISDVRTARIGGIRQDWVLGLSRRALLKWGFDWKTLAADYDYDSQQERQGTRNTDLHPDGRSIGGWLAARGRLGKALTLELGARFDEHTYLAEQSLRPRFNAALELDRRTTARLAWGGYAQAPGIHEIQVQDGDVEFRPAERAEQRAMGIERRFDNGLIVKLEGYDRRYTRLNPVYVNLNNGTAVFPEAEFDRAQLERERGRARGVELVVQKRNGGRFDWAASYSLAKAEDEVRFLPDPVPRTRDQRHTMYLDMSWTPKPRWNISWAWQFHTGWPYTARSMGGFAAVNEERLPSYHRLDARVTRSIPLRTKLLRIFVDVFNLYDRANPRGFEFISAPDDESRSRVRVPSKQLPLLPTVGVSLDF